MKAKIQVIIGLLTAIVCVTGILAMFISCLVPPHTSSNPPGFSCYLPLGLIFPIAYGITLKREKLIAAKTIFFIWCGGWLLSCVLFWLIDVVGVAGICAVSILELTVIIPIWIPISPFFEYSLGVRAVSGAVFMILLWIGVRGLKQIVKAEQSVFNLGD